MKNSKASLEIIGKNKILRNNPLIVLLLLISLTLTSSCSSIRVVSDYDKEVNFDDYKSYAFYKTGIDKAEINDLDKRRILRAIEAELSTKGYVKSQTPDVLISFFTRSRERVDVWNNGFGPYYYGWGWGWSPYNNWNTNVTTTTEGILYIDVIDAKRNELVWQGQGTGYLSQRQKEERIGEFVRMIFEKYPPQLK